MFTLHCTSTAQAVDNARARIWPDSFISQLAEVDLMKYCWLFVALSTTACISNEEQLAETEGAVQTAIPNGTAQPNPTGTSTTFSIAGAVDLTGPFFQDLGVNGRTCGTCHTPSQGWTISAAETRKLFDATGGLHPLFRTNDGSNTPNADTSTVEARRAAYSMLLTRGTIRVGIGIPAGEFELIAVDDPYNHASAAELSLFRRPLPSTNLTFIPRVMWDGRVTGATIPDALAEQANGATQGHAGRPTAISQQVREEIAQFESGLYNAQHTTNSLGSLDADGANGSTEALAGQAFVAGRFDLFDGWQNSDSEHRRAVYRGQELFNTKTRPNGAGACRGCHSAQNVGTNVNGTFFNIGVSADVRRQPDQPLYTLRRISTGEIVQTTDPGRALITGVWSDIGKFKVPSIRGLAARAPYFHSGLTDSFEGIIDFYEESLGFDFTPAEEADLAAFLSAL